jgi:hypothetical protein
MNGRIAIVVAGLALFVSLSGVVYAAATIGSAEIKDNSVHSRDIKNATIRTGDISKAARAALKGQKGATGPAGPVGPGGGNGQQGPQGVPGAPATNLHAYINGDPTASVLHGSATAVNRTGAGRYEVSFGRDLTNCTASVIVAENTPHAGANAYTGPDSNFGSVTDDEVAVVTYSLDVADGVTEVDTDFYVQVFC